MSPVLLLCCWSVDKQTYTESTVPVASEREEWRERGERGERVEQGELRAFSVQSDTNKLGELPELADE